MHWGQSGQPSPDWLSRTAAPVKMMKTEASSAASAYRRMAAGEGATIEPASLRAQPGQPALGAARAPAAGAG